MMLQGFGKVDLMAGDIELHSVLLEDAEIGPPT